MRKSKRQVVALALGALVLLIGVVQLCIATNGCWTLENVVGRVAKIICGALMIIVGAFLVSLGLGDKAGKAAGNFLRYILDRFLEAFNR